MMKSVKFGNKTALEIIDTDLKKQIKDFLSEKAKTRPLDKNYRFLNHGLLQHLKKFPHLVALSTFGKKFLIVLVQIEDKHQTIFVDRKKEMMIFMPMGFDKTLYQGTILDGELIKNNDGHWVYFINDILLFKGKSVFQKPLQERIEIVGDILTNQFKANNLDFCSFEMKQYFPLKYIQDLSTGYRLRLNYKCSGLYFKNEIRNEKPLLYIFPENRTPLGESNDVSNGHSNYSSSNTNTNTNTNMFSGGNKNHSVNSSKMKVLDDNILESIQNTKDSHVFLLKKMDYPDVYELYARKSGENVKIGIAGITSLGVSQKVAKMINDYSEDDEIKVECQYVQRFKKWEPIAISDEEVYQIE